MKTAWWALVLVACSGLSCEAGGVAGVPTPAEVEWGDAASGPTAPLDGEVSGPQVVRSDDDLLVVQNGASEFRNGVLTLPRYGLACLSLAVVRTNGQVVALSKADLKRVHISASVASEGGLELAPLDDCSDVEGESPALAVLALDSGTAAVDITLKDGSTFMATRVPVSVLSNDAHSVALSTPGQLLGGSGGGATELLALTGATQRLSASFVGNIMARGRIGWSRVTLDVLGDSGVIQTEGRELVGLRAGRVTLVGSYFSLPIRAVVTVPKELSLAQISVVLRAGFSAQSPVVSLEAAASDVSAPVLTIGDPWFLTPGQCFSPTWSATYRVDGARDFRLPEPTGGIVKLAGLVAQQGVWCMDALTPRVPEERPYALCLADSCMPGLAVVSVGSPTWVEALYAARALSVRGGAFCLGAADMGARVAASEVHVGTSPVLAFGVGSGSLSRGTRTGEQQCFSLHAPAAAPSYLTAWYGGYTSTVPVRWLDQ